MRSRPLRADLAQPRDQRARDGWAVGTAERRSESLVYVSLGSLGSADVPLMKRLIDALAHTPYRYVVSKGPQHQEYELADNMIGAEFLPQVSVLPHVDAVITHGGNNTTTECMWFGKPMLVLPIFWDQHDNAQRVHETGYGMRLPTYSFDDDELASALSRLLTDEPLRARAARPASGCASARERSWPPS